MSEEDLVTADVARVYRTAESQAGESRTPDGLLPQADGAFGESVDQIADGPAGPGQSCAPGAEYLPDNNGDGWGACAKVEGYVAVEDRCSEWKGIAEATRFPTVRTVDFPDCSGKRHASGVCPRFSGELRRPGFEPRSFRPRSLTSLPDSNRRRHAYTSLTFVRDGMRRPGFEPGP